MITRISETVAESAVLKDNILNLLVTTLQTLQMKDLSGLIQCRTVTLLSRFYYSSKSQSSLFVPHQIYNHIRAAAPHLCIVIHSRLSSESLSSSHSLTQPAPCDSWTNMNYQHIARNCALRDFTTRCRCFALHHQNKPASCRSSVVLIARNILIFNA